MTVTTKALAVRYLKDEVVWVTPEGRIQRKLFEGIRPEFQLIVVKGFKATISEAGVANVTKVD